jgi:hypothetical protein
MHRIEHAGERTLLPEMADEAMPDVEMFGMRAVNTMKNPPNGVEAFRNGDVMHVVGHETVSNDAQEKLATTVSE